MYPPLFHLCFATFSDFFNITPMELCKIAQPFFSAYLIGVITYVSYKLSDEKTALATGFLSMFCFITFNRSVICTPATIAIGLSMLSCLFIYKATTENKVRYLLFSALFLAFIWNLHMATALLTCGVVGLYSIIQVLRKKLSLKFILYYVLTVLLVGMPWWIYIALNYNMFFNSLAGSNLSLMDFFFKYYGILPSLLMLIGYFVLIKKNNEKSLLLIVWTLSLVLLSQLNYFGLNIVSIRILEVASYPLILVSGIGLHYIYNNYISKSILKKIFAVIFIFLAIASALLYVDSYTPDVLAVNDCNGTLIDENIHLIVNPITTSFKPTVISSRFANSSLAHERYDIMKWFIHENSTNIVVSEDSIMDTIIVSTSRTPVVYGGFTESIPGYVTDPIHIIRGWSNSDELHGSNIGYLLLKNQTDIPYYSELCYNNSYYKICRIKMKYR